MPQIVFGCDLSKARIDIHDLATGRDFFIANEPAAIAAWLGEINADARVVFEATSGCDHALMSALDGAGIVAHRVNPRQAREFARATGRLAKSDRVDARVLADMGARLDLPTFEPPEPVRQLMAEIILRREQLVGICKAEQGRQAGFQDRELARGARRLVRVVKAQILHLEIRLTETIRNNDALADAERRLRTIPGIGPLIAATLIARLPELGRVDRRAIASLAGVAPLARDSGTSRGKRRIWGGRRDVRRALFIAAVGASRFAPTFKAVRDRMLAQGKAKKTVLIAIARRILVTLNAMLRTGTDFQPNPEQ